MSMKTYKLRNATKGPLVSAIQAVMPGWDGQADIYQENGKVVKYLAKIPTGVDELGDVIYSSYYHADLLAPAGLDFGAKEKCDIATPYHKFAGHD